MRKPAFQNMQSGKLACSASEASQSLQIFSIKDKIILFRKYRPMSYTKQI